MCNKQEYMDCGIYRKGGWIFKYIYIFCFANMKKKRPYFLCAGIAIFLFVLVCLEILLNLYKKESSQYFFN